MKIDIKGFFLGGFLGLLVLLFLGAVIGFSAVYMLQLTGGVYEAIENNDVTPFYILGLAGILMQIFGNFVSGYIVAKISNHNRLFTAIAVGIFGTVLAIIPFFPNEELDIVFLFVSAAIPLPFHYLGASFFIKRVNKFKNENASVAGTDAGKTRRPF